MERDEWLKALSAFNNQEKAPNYPFCVIFGEEPYVFATDMFIITVSKAPEGHTYPIVNDKLADSPNFRQVVEQAQALQRAAIARDKIDALSLQELVGPTEWNTESYNKLANSEKEHPALKIGNSYYSQPLLARALAAWTEPIATISFSRIEGKNADVLLISANDLIVMCSPYYFEEGTPETLLQIPEWMFLPEK